MITEGQETRVNNREIWTSIQMSQHIHVVNHVLLTVDQSRDSRLRNRSRGHRVRDTYKVATSFRYTTHTGPYDAEAASSQSRSRRINNGKE